MSNPVGVPTKIVPEVKLSAKEMDAHILALRVETPEHVDDLESFPGIQVVISTYRRPQLLKECLESIEKGLENVKVSWCLWVGIDGFDKEALQVCRDHRHVTKAINFNYWEFYKAGTVAEAKNRVLAFAKRREKTHPWILLMDDDDLFYSARVTEMLPVMMRRGHLMAVGDYLYESLRKTQTRIPALECIKIPKYCFPPSASVIHTSLIPKDGRFFDTAVTIWEDFLTWSRIVVEHNFDIAPIATKSPVFMQRKVATISAGYPSEDNAVNAQMSEAVVQLTRKRYGSGLNAKSLSTLCIGEHFYSELKVLIKSIELFGPKVPVLLLCDPAVEKLVIEDKLGQGLVDLVIWPVATVDWIKEQDLQFDHADEMWQALFPREIMVCKSYAIERAVQLYGNTLYVDSDTVFVGATDYDRFDLSVDACVCDHLSPTVGMCETFGYWQAGIIFVTSEKFARTWREHFWKDNNFGDQRVLTHVVPQFNCGVFPPGYNVGPWCCFPEHKTHGRCFSKPAAGIWTPATADTHWSMLARNYLKSREFEFNNEHLFWRGDRLRLLHYHACPEKTRKKAEGTWMYNEDFRLGMLLLFKNTGNPRFQLLLDLMTGP